MAQHLMKTLATVGFAWALAIPQSLPAKQADALAASAHERMIPLEGGRNFRDIGGYRTVDGREVRWATLYRSGSLGSLAPASMSRLQHMHIRAIIDLRMTAERRQDQSNWLPLSRMGYWTRDYQLGGDQASLARLFSDPAKLTAESVRAMMVLGYRSMPKELAPQYRELFARLIAPGSGAVVVNCTAGKDRTGIAAALVLATLGVPYETVREDFLLSNSAMGMALVQDAISPQLAALPHEVVKPLLGVEGAYLDAAFDQIRADYGSIEAYLDKELGMGPLQRAALKRRMLTKAAS